MEEVSKLPSVTTDNKTSFIGGTSDLIRIEYGLVTGSVSPLEPQAVKDAEGVAR
jgi:hypothetical protein